MKKRTLKLAKKIALVLTAGSMMMPITACREKNAKENQDEIVSQSAEESLLDTSDITFQNYLDNYIESYNAGTIVNGSEMYSYFADLYHTSSSANIDENTVDLPTKTGALDITLDNGSYIINNINSGSNPKTLLQINLDGSYSVIEETREQSKRIEFDKTGNLILLEQTDSSNKAQNPYKVYKYVNGNVNEYSVYDDNNELLEKREKDGSYTIFGHTLDSSRYKYYPDNTSKYDLVKYFYNKNDELEKIETYKTAQSNSEYYWEEKTIFSPNGDYYKYHKGDNKVQNYSKEIKTENKYNKYQNTITNVTENGETHTTVMKFDYTVLSPSRFYNGTTRDNNAMGDIVYESIDGVVKTAQNEDGIIYIYQDDGTCITDGYKVQEDGIMYYDQNGKPLRLVDYGKKTVYYTDEGELTAITEDDKETVYYNYENSLVKSVHAQNDISVEANNQNFTLKKGGYLSFYPNGQAEYLLLDKEKYEYISFYDTGEKSQVREDDVFTSYYKDGSVSSVQNFRDEIINVSGYNLKKNSIITFDENGNIKKYIYDENYSIENYYTSDGEYNGKTIIEGDKKYWYNKDNEITDIWSEPVKDEYGFITYTVKTPCISEPEEIIPEEQPPEEITETEYSEDER